jgi:hypothetical protein
VGVITVSSTRIYQVKICTKDTLNDVVFLWINDGRTYKFEEYIAKVSVDDDLYKDTNSSTIGVSGEGNFFST